MVFVHGHARDAGWVVSHYRRPQLSGDAQLDMDLPAPRPAPEEDRAVEQADQGPQEPQES